MKYRLLTRVVVAMLLPVAAVDANPGHVYMQPDLKVGEQLIHVFSKTMSIKGDGFKEVVGRTSGTAHITVKTISPDAIVTHDVYRYDGHSVGVGTGKRLADGVTDCWSGKCAVNRSTSGTFFNRTLWGQPPRTLRAGITWTALIAKPWEAGPAGTETIRVSRLDPHQQEIILARDGSGTGPSAHDLRKNHLVITTDQGRQIKVRLIPGRTTWRGLTTVRKGVIVSDTIMVERHVTLVTASGQKFEGEERIYTLENLLRDTLPLGSTSVPLARDTTS